MEFITVVLMVWGIAYAVERAKAQWRSTRDQHARTLHRHNPAWSPKKVRRHANRRAMAWWLHEAAEGFPTIRAAWNEDREHVRVLREQELIATDQRRATWRTALENIRDARTAHAEAVDSGETAESFGVWLQHRPAATPTPAAGAGDAEVAADEFHAAVRTGRTNDAVAAQQRYQAAQRGTSPPTPAGGASPAHARQWPPGPPPAGPAVQAGNSAQPAGSPSPGSGQPAGGTATTDGGNGMGMPNGELAGDSPYRSALTAFDGYDQIAQQHEQAAETLEAQLTLHGFDRDQGLMTHIRSLRETAGNIRMLVGGARQALVGRHAAGDEYHTTGVDADASGFRH